MACALPWVGVGVGPGVAPGAAERSAAANRGPAQPVGGHGHKEADMTPNGITAARILCAFAAVTLFRLSDAGLRWGLAAVLVTVVTIALDGLDGYVARRKNM